MSVGHTLDNQRLVVSFEDFQSIAICEVDRGFVLAKHEQLDAVLLQLFNDQRVTSVDNVLQTPDANQLHVLGVLHEQPVILVLLGSLVGRLVFADASDEVIGRVTVHLVLAYAEYMNSLLRKLVNVNLTDLHDLLG